MEATKAKQNILIRYLPSILLLLFYLSEGYGKIAEKSWTEKSDLAKWVKFSVLVFITVMLWKYWKKGIWFFCLFVIFIIGQSTLSDGFNEQVIVTFAKYCFPIILFFFFVKYPLTDRAKYITFKCFEGIFIGNSILIFIGYIFDIHWFYAYKWGRFGFNGLLINSGTATYVYVIGLFSLLLWYKKDFFKKYSTYVLIAASILLGTKGAIIGLLSIFPAYFLFYSNLSSTRRKQIVFGIAGIGLVLFYIFFFQIGVFNELRKEEGLLTSVLSLRDEAIMDRMLPYIRSEWSWTNYLFGGYSDVDSRSQMGFIDIFYFWGIIGGLFYLIIYFKNFITFRLNIVAIVILAPIIIIAFFSGNFFENASIAIYLLVLKESFQNRAPQSLIRNMNKVNILNTSIDNLTMSETLERVSKSIENGEQIHHVVVNAGKIVAMQTDPELRKSVNESDIINADGQAVVWASRILGKPLKERVAGIDLMANLVEMGHQKKHRIFLFGAKEGVVKSVVDLYTERYGPSLIAGYRNGYFPAEEEAEIALQIAQSGAQMLFVAITSPKKENFLYKHREALKNVNLIMGVGGSFDVVAGKTKRAPRWMQKSGLEWFYRFTQEPRRMWKRYLIGNSKFIYLVLKEKLSN